MRKSSGVIMAIVLLGFGSMMMAANVALKPLQRYARIGEDLTAAFENLRLIQPGSKVFVLGRTGDQKRLAKEGWGLLVELAPADEVTQAPGRLERLAFRACEEAHSLYQRAKDRELDWFEVKFLLAKDEVRRVLLVVDERGRLGVPQPPLPLKLP